MTDRIELTTERLVLRPFKFTDVPDVVAYASDPEWGGYMPIPRPYTVRDGEEFVARAVLRDWQTYPSFAISLADQLIGAISLRIDANHARAELGYGIGRAYWGQGLTPEAASGLLDWGFPTYELAKIFAFADLRNSQSWRVMEKLGMTREALLRKHDLHEGQRTDDVMYGVLREEWEARRVA